MERLFVLTSLSHYMLSRFPGGNGSPRWEPIVLSSKPRPLAEVQGHLNRIRASHNGVMPSNRTFEIVEVKR